MHCRKKKHLILSTFLSIVISSLAAQELPGSWAEKGIKVGEKMPDLLLGEVINNYTGKTRFSDFKGKLVILDFWTSWCGSCIDEFPHIEKLQKQFGDSIQIFLVNSYETQQEIEKRVSKRIKFPNVPSIVNAKELKDIFPAFYAGLHVWIDKDGIVRVKGSSLNTNSEKIRQILAGKPITYLIEGSTYNASRDHSSFYKLIENNLLEPPTFGGAFYPFSEKYAVGGGIAENVTDTNTQVVRSSYINVDPVMLYDRALKDELGRRWEDKKIISSLEISPWINFYLLYVNDTLRYTQIAPTDKEITDIVWRNGNYCYEQLLPSNISEKERKEYMLDDLNKYFGYLYGIEKVQINKINIPCYVLVRTSQQDKLKSKTKEPSDKEIITRGKKMRQFSNVPLHDAINSTLVELAVRRSNYLTKDKTSLYFILDETGYEAPVDIQLPSWEQIINIADLKAALKPYDLDIILQNRELDMIVIKEKAYQQKKHD